MALSPGRPLIIPVERISYVTTPTLAKKDLVPWTHISGRPDLTVVFEKETFKSSKGLAEEQTLLKIKQGIKAVETVALEDFVCQAAVAEQRATSSPDSPPHFAIFLSAPNIAFRYELLNGHFHKVQLLFRDEIGCQTMVEMLKTFQLPIVNKASPSQRQVKASTARSDSTSTAFGAPSIFSSFSDDKRTIRTAHSWLRNGSPEVSRSTFPGENSSSIRVADVLPNFHKQPSATVVRPGPSYVESFVEPDPRQRLNQAGWQPYSRSRLSPEHVALSRTKFLQHPLQLSTSYSRQSPELSRAIDFDGGVIASVKHSDSTEQSHTSYWQAKRSELLPELPPSAQPIISRRTGMAKSPANASGVVGKSTRSESNGDITYPGLKVSQKSTATYASISDDFRGPVSADSKVSPTKKPTARKRAAKKSFKNSAMQTISGSVSKATQTMHTTRYKPIAIGPEPNLFIAAPANHSIESRLHAVLLARTPLSNSTRILEPDKQDAQNLSSSKVATLYKETALRSNKFGKRHQHRRVLSENANDRVATQLENHLFKADQSKPQLKQQRRINKFGRRRLLVYA